VKESCGRSSWESIALMLIPSRDLVPLALEVLVIPNHRVKAMKHRPKWYCRIGSVRTGEVGVETRASC
jgi:hypothetical protein